MRDKARAHQIKNLALIQVKREKKKIKRDLLRKLQKNHQLSSMEELSISNKDLADSRSDSLESISNGIWIVHNEFADLQNGGGVIQSDF